MFGQKRVMGRADYLVKNLNEGLLFLTVTKSNGTEGRPVAFVPLTEG